MPITRPERSSRGPPELPGLTAASIWMRSWRTGPSGVSWNVRPSPEMTPVLIDAYSPNGLPTTNASLPTRTEPGLPSVAGTSGFGSVSACRTAMSFSGWLLRIEPADVDPSAKVSLIDFASATTWRLVRMSPASSMITPVPRLPPGACDGVAFPLPSSVWMSTSEGWMTA